jgi:hypothetical protein
VSAVGFAPSSSEDSELQLLREACERLNFAIRGIKEAQSSLSQLNIGQTRQRLNNAQWQAREAKKVLTQIGRSKKNKTAIRRQ